MVVPEVLRANILTVWNEAIRQLREDAPDLPEKVEDSIRVLNEGLFTHWDYHASHHYKHFMTVYFASRPFFKVEAMVNAVLEELDNLYYLDVWAHDIREGRDISC